ncbi:MAG: tetratricopeptide repeat protein [Salinibacter sp.]
MIDVEIDEAFQNDLSEEQQDRLPELLDAAGLDLPGVPDNLGLVFTAVLRSLLRNATDPKTEDRFRHALIDSRSGLADVGGLCLRGLPDTRVVLSGLNKQNLEGTRMVLNTLSREERADDELIVVFSPVPEGEASLVDQRIETAKDTLTFRDPDGEDRVSEEQIQLLHYHPRIALEETPFTESFHRRTRIFDEYETLTDDLLALTGSNARSLVSDALERFREDDDSEAETSAGGKEEENRYSQLAAELIPAAFLDENHVQSTVDGLCTQMQRSGPYAPATTSLYKLWISLSPDEVRVLGTTANYYYEVGRQVASESGVGEAEPFFQYAFDLSNNIVKNEKTEELAWYNWGVYLDKLGQIILRDDDLDRAGSLYRDAFDKYQKAIKIEPNYHQAWHNWGSALGRLAQLVQKDNRNRAVSRYRDAFEKYQEATDIKPNKHEAWFSWGLNLVRLGWLLRSQNQTQEARQAFSDAVEKLYESISHEGGEAPLYWLILALAERDQNGDIETAADHLTSLLEEAPDFISEFYDEDAKAVRAHPELREILDAYRQQIDEEELEEAEIPDEMGPADRSE